MVIFEVAGDLHNHVNGDPSRKVATLEEEQPHGGFDGGGEAGREEICWEVRTHGKLLVSKTCVPPGLTTRLSHISNRQTAWWRKTFGFFIFRF